MRGLALCAGYGGLELALGLVFGNDFRTVCYVERDYVQAGILAARMEDKTFHPAPIWDDLTTFDGNRWRGTVDIITAGFPCQPFSVAGKRLGTADERWIWPDIARIIREIRPRFVFLENVPGLIRHGLGRVAGDLAESGFSAEWDCFTAAEVGAPHKRERVFILAHAEGNLRRRSCRDGERNTSNGSGDIALADARRIGDAPVQHLTGTGGATANAGALGGELVDATGPGMERHGGGERARERHPSAGSVQRLGDTESGGQRANGRAPGNAGHADQSTRSLADTTQRGYLPGREVSGRRSRSESTMDGRTTTDTERGVLADTGDGFISLKGRRPEKRTGIRSAIEVLGNAGKLAATESDDETPTIETERGGGIRKSGDTSNRERATFPPGRNDAAGWSAYIGAGGAQPAIRRGADGSAGRNDRLFSAGNGVVPVVAAYAFVTLATRLGLELAEVDE